MKTFVAGVCIVALSAVGALAQAPRGLDDVSAGRKITGSVYQSYSAHAYRSSAANHARALRQYSTTGSVPKAVAEEHAAELRRNLSATDIELAKLETTTKGDQVATDLIADIKTHQAAALKACGMVEAECAKHNADGAAVASCCTNMETELKAAEDAHTKLMQHLKLPVPGHVPTK